MTGRRNKVERTKSCAAGPAKPTKTEAEKAWPGEKIVQCHRCRGWQREKPRGKKR